MVHEGKILHRLLKEKDIGETEVSRRFNISRRAVYNYYKSENISNKVKRRFLETFGINITKQIHIQLYSSDDSFEGVSEPESAVLQRREIGDLEGRVENQRRTIDQLEAASVEKDKRIESLEKMLNVALKPGE